MSVIPYADKDKAPVEKKEAVRQMFDNIAGRYDLMNDIMTVGFHRRWKTLAAREVSRDGAIRVLDIACGTGDIGFMIEKIGVKENEFFGRKMNMASRKERDSTPC